MTAMSDITIRRSTTSDRRSLERLAGLDSRSLADGPYLLAESGGALVAALPADGGAAIADPFRRTAAIVELLRVRATEASRPARHGAGVLRRAVRLRPRAAAQA